MAVYSIRDLENFTRIKAHTLRIWEQRYKLLSPERTDTKIRVYSDQDLKKILNVSLLYDHGYKISKIAALSESEILAIAGKILQPGKSSGNRVETDFFIQKIIELDEAAIKERLQSLSREHGVPDMYTHFMIPLLNRIGELWQTDVITVMHEHFFSNILRDFVIAETAKLTKASHPRGKVILFLHEREQHELSLLYYHYVLKSRGFDCYYLGQRVPMEDIKLAIASIQPDYLFTSIIADTNQKYFTMFMKKLGELFPFSKIYMGGNQLKKYARLIPSEVNKIKDQKDVEI